ncbi:gliding motility-associated lipoprotein GldB [Catalinimonas alkaloidigena]|uniref:Gliding motility-associated lipoprotein GldB n=2 Tax=Catalinimonas alkaloidigena TaxID=1075417 RepID=A0A1G9ESZ8_9BACT|nr:gliding motility-associated lipoprotein GldB [Catalinimonas alkaloidigena]
MDQMLFETQSKDDITALLNAHPLFTEKFLNRSQLPHDSILVNQLYALVHDSHMDTLFQQTSRYYEEIDDVRNDLEDALQHVKYYYPDFVIPKVYTIVSGFGTDLFATDSLIVVGLEYFMGDDPDLYKPAGLPEYMQRRYQKNTLVPMVLTLISEKYNQADRLDNSLISEMTYYGKAYYFTKQMLPCTPDSLIIGYTSEEMRTVESYQKSIWAHFVDKQLLYETNHFEVTRYVGERPFVGEISRSCPGRVGRWVGWEIVRKYMEETDTTLPELMAMTDGKKLLEQSRYRPRE